MDTSTIMVLNRGFRRRFLRRSRKSSRERGTTTIAARCCSAGFTLVEVMVAVMILGVLIAICIQQSRRARENALLASCMSFHIAINREVFQRYAEFGDFPTNLDDILGDMHAYQLSSNFNYVGGEDFNKGHGNDWDGNDGDNPGKKNDDTGWNPGYYMRCAHDHSYLGILFVDSGNNLPPKAIRDEADARGVMPNGNGAR
jgi:prepilin-type N-terminal cleavage/methylation domain-containing protein